MAFETITTRRDDLDAWYATRPDLFRREPWVGRILVWSIVAVVALALSIVVFVFPEVVDTLTQDRQRRAGAARLGLTIVPPLVLAFALFLLLRYSTRFRMTGVGPLTGDYSLYFGADLEPAAVLAALERGAADPAGLENVFRAIAASTGGVYHLHGYRNAQARVNVTGVQRVGDKAHTIEWEPVITRGDASFDGMALVKRTGNA